MSNAKKSTIEHWEENERFVHECLRYRGLLYQIAERILRGPEYAEEAVNRTLTLATRMSHKKKPAGEFRSWLVRLLIEEALLIRRKRMAQERSFANTALSSGHLSVCSDWMASR
jgi:DNA-directed RNA polymerase specialized sigma24 family protein